MKIKARIKQLQDAMKRAHIDYYLIPTSDFHNSEYVCDYFKVREYFSGFTGSNGTLLVSRNDAGLWTDGRYFVQAEKELEGSGIQLFRMQDKDVPSIKEYLEQNMKDGEVLGFDGRVVTVSYAKELEKALQDKDVEFRYDIDVAGKLWKKRPQVPISWIRVLPESLCGQSLEDKLAMLRMEMHNNSCGAHLITSLDDIMWLFNIRGNDIECNPVAYSYAFITMTECCLFVQNHAVSVELRIYADKRGIDIRDYNEIENFLETSVYEKRILLNENIVNCRLYGILKSKAKIINLPNPSEKLKAVKNPTELGNMEKVYLKDSVAVTKFIYWLKKNVGKIPLNEYTASMHMDELREQIDGFLELSFPTIGAYKENAAMMHYCATETDNKELQPEGMFLVDSGGQYMGGTTDVTRTIVLGNIDDTVKKHFTAVAVGMLRLSDARFLYGCTGRNLDILARGPVWEMGIDYKCGTGHGIGYILNVHEGPQNIRWRYAENTNEAVIEAGMVISNEPGVYKAGSYGIRTENVIVAKNGEKNDDGQFMYFDTLTYVPIDLDGIDVSVMQPRDIERLNAYHRKVYDKISPYLNAEEREWLKENTRPVSATVNSIQSMI
ncbi:MAG: aminopeptidase P family protein [Lachnospiraceae bacterium]|nr:aminopeptidase P family protein [Lachnospiraceae bacterium]